MDDGRLSALPRAAPARDGTLLLSFCGDVMLGRGIDQILPHSGDPELREEYVRDARSYVELAEAVNGPIPRPVSFSWPWGDALEVWDVEAPDARVMNIETSITRSEDFAPGKAVHYRMIPSNIPCLVTARPDVCVLANNHLLDFGHRGLDETLDTLADARLKTAGAGRNARDAWAAAVVTAHAGARVLVFSFGATSSGIPPTWAATEDRAGVALLRALSDTSAADVAGRIQGAKRPGDIVVASVHWGSNWGYQVSGNQTGFAHALIDRGVDVVHGHSSHHPRPIEVYRDKLILYGCGDFIDDYEGIPGHETYRPDLRLLYLATLDAGTGELTELRMAPLQSRQMRLHRAPSSDSVWLRHLLDKTSDPFGSRFRIQADGLLALRRA